jgi:hypothetical protein
MRSDHEESIGCRTAARFYVRDGSARGLERLALDLVVVFDKTLLDVTGGCLERAWAAGMPRAYPPSELLNMRSEARGEITDLLIRRR